MSYADPARANQGGQATQQEPTGPITSDSLAAESVNAGAGFSENDNATVQSVKGSNSTFNTTDTTGATALPAAVDGSSRAKQEDKGLGSDERGVTGVKYPDGDQPSFDGITSPEGYVGGPSDTGTSTTTGSKYTGATGDSFADGGSGLTSSDDTSSSAISSGPSATRVSQTSSNEPLATGRAGDDYGTSSRPDDDTAPNYAATVSGALRSEGELQPKGKDLTEGGIPETKTFTGDVGGPHDPGRAAEQSFANTDAGGLVGSGEQQYKSGSNTGGQYDVLSSERA